MKENFSGAQKNIYRLLVNLNKDKIKPILVGQFESPLTDLCDSKNIDVKIIQFPYGLGVYDGRLLRFNFKIIYRFIKAFFIYNLTLIKYFKEVKPDVVWCDNIRTFVTVFIACKYTKVKVIWNIWSEPKGKIAWVLHRVGLFLSDRINLEYSRQGEKIFGKLSKKNIFKKKIMPLYTGVSDFEKNYGTNIRKELSLELDVIILIMASNIVPGKGQLDLVKCMLNITNEFPNVHLLLPGTSVESNKESIRYYDEVKRVVFKNNLNDKVHLLGWRSDIRDLYRQSNIYISTSYGESFPDAVREAMLASLPIIVTDVGGTRELVELNSNGYLFQPGDLGTLSGYIRSLLNDPELSVKMGAKSKEIIDERFSTKKYVNEFEDMVQEIFH